MKNKIKSNNAKRKLQYKKERSRKKKTPANAKGGGEGGGFEKKKMKEILPRCSKLLGCWDFSECEEKLEKWGGGMEFSMLDYRHTRRRGAQTREGKGPRSNKTWTIARLGPHDDAHKKHVSNPQLPIVPLASPPRKLISSNNVLRNIPLLPSRFCLFLSLFSILQRNSPW
ncbi:hypothetical protein GQ44DRAFT_45546 [Phaeosphaeriaceae sp. PMI808]|nr:hypothetical protein GQ44DRAFT_45546 [Phaeosphaeriaceae sp. PMI808]